MTSLKCPTARSCAADTFASAVRMESVMDVKQRLFRLYASYFDRNAQAFEKVNQFVSSVGADWLRIEKLDEAKFFDYLYSRSTSESVKRRWLSRILRGHETTQLDSLLHEIFAASKVNRPHFLSESRKRSGRDQR